GLHERGAERPTCSWPESCASATRRYRGTRIASCRGRTPTATGGPLRCSCPSLSVRPRRSNERPARTPAPSSGAAMAVWLLIAACLSVSGALPAGAHEPPLGSSAADAGAAWRSTVPPRLLAVASDTLTFTPSLQSMVFDSTGHEPLTVPTVRVSYQTESEWLRAPMGDHLLDHPDPWIADHPSRSQEIEAVVDYNRVDLLRYGVHYQAQRPRTMYPRLGARFEYSTGRERTLYGFQLEQPLLPTARF